MISVEKSDSHTLVDIGFELLLNYFETDLRITIDYSKKMKKKSFYIDLYISHRV